MACFVVPAAEAVVVTAAYFITKKKEQKTEATKTIDGSITDNGSPLGDYTISANGVAGAHVPVVGEEKVTWSKRLGWLLTLLWGGVALLAFEHFWHGEVVPFPPFLTAMANPEDARQMLYEMSTVGVSMAVTVTVVWGIFCAAVEAKARKIKASMLRSGK